MSFILLWNRNFSCVVLVREDLGHQLRVDVISYHINITSILFYSIAFPITSNSKSFRSASRQSLTSHPRHNWHTTGNPKHTPPSTRPPFRNSPAPSRSSNGRASG